MVPLPVSHLYSGQELEVGEGAGTTTSLQGPSLIQAAEGQHFGGIEVGKENPWSQAWST